MNTTCQAWPDSARFIVMSSAKNKTRKPTMAACLPPLPVLGRENPVKQRCLACSQPVYTVNGLQIILHSRIQFSSA